MPEQTHIDFVPMLARFPAITLAEMDGVRLMNRVDTKYVTDESCLGELLSDARSAGYRVLEIDGQRINAYDSLYYDTAALKMFTDHHNRRLVRQKVRTRMYVDSGLTFLEIKRKDNRGRTRKKRLPLPPADFLDFRGNGDAAAFLSAKSDYAADGIAPVVETLFRRITLVNRALTERLTVDTCLGFVNRRTGREATLKDAVIIELKQDGRADSEMKKILLGRRVKPLRVSKYCVGVTLTDPAAKSNRFKMKIRTLEKIIHSHLW